MCIRDSKSNSLKRLIKGAGFDQPEAYIADINYAAGRKLNRSLIERLATCEYITEHRNLFITGATGSGKTYMACAFGMEACKQRYKTKYVRLPDMLLELDLARTDGTYKKVQAKYANPVLLIIDAVSYTHLDVYKRQSLACPVTRMSRRLIQARWYYFGSAWT